MYFQRVLAAGPTERRVLELARQARRSGILTPLRAFRLRALQSRYDLSPPDPEEWSWRFPRGRVPDCSGCSENCCTGELSTVHLKLVDLALFVDRGWTDRLTLEKPEFTAEELGRRPRLQEMVASLHWRAFPSIRREADGACPFLEKGGGCGIHQERPWTCRRFPYTLDVDRREIFWADRCGRWREAGASEPQARELAEAVFHNLYVEKVRDLTIMAVCPEEVHKLGLSRWLDLSGVSRP